VQINQRQLPNNKLLTTCNRLTKWRVTGYVFLCWWCGFICREGCRI